MYHWTEEISQYETVALLRTQVKSKKYANRVYLCKAPTLESRPRGRRLFYLERLSLGGLFFAIWLKDSTMAVAPGRVDHSL